MQKKKLWLRILVGTAALAGVGFCLALVTSFYGNPISAALATSKIRTYVAETYPQENFVVPQAAYNFKDGSYGSFIQSQTSVDTAFRVEVLRDGRIDDNYPAMVSARFNTFSRLEAQLDREVETILRGEYPYPTRLILAAMKDEADAARIAALRLDMPFDLYHPPLPVELTVWTSCEQPDYPTLAQRLLELKALMARRGVPVSRYSLDLEYPYHEENGVLLPENFNGLAVYDFPAENLVDSPDLPRILEEYQRQQEAEGSKEKQAEMK